MAQHEEKTCPRCEKNFECKCGSINLCQCSAVTLTEELSQQLKNDYADCLCIQCLREIKSTSPVSLNKAHLANMHHFTLHR